MVFSTVPSDPARSRLRALGAGATAPPGPPLEPLPHPPSRPPTAPREPASRGWPAAPEGTPAGLRPPPSQAPLRPGERGDDDALRAGRAGDFSGDGYSTRAHSEAEYGARGYGGYGPAYRESADRGPEYDGDERGARRLGGRPGRFRDPHLHGPAPRSGGDERRGRRGPGAFDQWDDGWDDHDDEWEDHGDDEWEDDPHHRSRGRLDDPDEHRPSAWSADSRAARLAERWLPASWRGARWDPGRTGALVLALVAAAAAVVAAAGVWSDRPTTEPLAGLPVVEAASGTGRPTTTRPASGAPAPAVPGAPLVVSVGGRVAHPGLLRVPDGSRVGDAISGAGGALPDTDLTGLNLATRLADGDQVLVGVTPPPGAAAAGAGAAGAGAATAGAGGAAAGGAAAAGTSSGAASGAAASGAGPVNLNTATLEQLDTLPGVGPATAKKILDWRTQNGRFASVDQLQEVNGIGDARLATLRPLVTV